MDSDVFTDIPRDEPLPLAALRLLVPPLQLMAASMWQVLRKRDVLSYWKVSDFVSLVVDMVPELLMDKHRTQLNLGLRARYIIELCRNEHSSEMILSYLEKMTSPHPTLIRESDDESVKMNFLELIQILLKDPEKRKHFFMDIFPAEYGPQYDSDLQTLFAEFLCRLFQLVPVPDLEQTVSWLGAECSLLEDCLQTVSEPTDLKNLLQHHKNLGHLDQHVPPASMGDNISSSLSALPPRRLAETSEQPDQSDPLQDLYVETQPAPEMAEIVTVSDYSEVEIEASSNVEVVTEENCFEGREDTVGECSVVVYLKKTSEEEPEREATELPSSSQHKAATGPHDCPHCEKKFKFASSLLAHSVIHTGERPHRCTDCGRCFSFRQSLDRHRRTHRKGRTYDCVDTACMPHRQTHTEDGVHSCHLCSVEFSCQLALASHLKTHSDDGSSDKLKEGLEGLPETDEAADVNEASAEHTDPDCPVETGDRPFSESIRDNGVKPPNVRTSGRKRRPTMKIQAIHLQMHMATNQRNKCSRANPSSLRPLPIVSSEHSYGSPLVSKQGGESSPADASVVAFSCPQCSFQDSEEGQVLQHINKVHPTDAADQHRHLSCADCGKVFRFHSLLKAHQRVHTGEQPFSCSQCGRQFSFKQSLERHKQTHSSGNKLSCLICGELFKSATEHARHKSDHLEDGDYQCSECGQTFSWKAALVKHLKTHGVDAGEVEDSFKCSHCNLGFSCERHLNKHILTHKEEKPHSCNCGKSFPYRAALTAHQRTHQRERPHICTQCGKGFLYKGGLLSHMKIHSEEMPFMCSFCGKSFKRERNMKKHERCHTRENVFRCSQCDKSFVYKATLVRHELTHSGERPYLCSDCGKGFFSHAELLKHERFHTGHKPFQCPHCGKKFTQSCYLTIHLRYHTGARPYSCSECDKSFLSANRLKRHQRTHSGEKPYLCLECGKGFRQSYHLKTHLRTHLS
ncbi:zinc finger protein 420-like [Poecilia reticulata]|uniref:Zinc finger protein 420-like n=1 Tax=Poecilia reticulata TaxID=8081 RepID=A0A3P9PH00_POERE|nr:PREDICTED: zinc finger protein 420-like [Poecilia reticulata]